MAKHAHRLLLNQKKTWRCTLPGCRYFIHVGLAHILPGMQSICWQCGEEFTLSEEALEDEQPLCIECKNKQRGGPSRAQVDEMVQIMEVRAYMKSHGLTRASELSGVQKSMLRMRGIPDSIIEMLINEEKPEKPIIKIVKKPELNDEIEVIEPVDSVITDDYPWLQGNGEDE